MRLLFLGDVMGRAGREMVYDELPKLRAKYKLDFVIVNGENSAAGFGMTEEIALDLFDAGADVITMGDHCWDKKEALIFIEKYDNLVRPLNFTAGTPGRGTGMYAAKNGAMVLVIHALGRVFMPPRDCPFMAIEQQVELSPLGQVADVIFVDFHAEATSEKMAMGQFLDGRVSAMVGTHTHVPTGDAHIMAGGTAYMTDAGMCGDYNSVIGSEPEEPLNRFLHGRRMGSFTPAVGAVTLSGICVDIDDKTGLANHCSALRLGGVLQPQSPDFWPA
ncbi:MAG: TIGR00282 family metallophosphoesterase [Rhizobiales bacterium]|nr:TIGR00282 family metallophosphoesterase [Hyphomicrobiales bacterium]NRB14166.1 TIGR00282 family metallophosphoesterase [Hyphomicrobiales bacterium]